VSQFKEGSTPVKENETAKSDSYKAAGVDIDLADNLLEAVKDKINLTRRPEALVPVGGFGGLFKIDLTKYKHPVMVVSIDGVGTKLMVAGMMNKHDTVGHDIVNHCINDIAVQGAEPVYFVDYIGIGKLRSPLYEQVLGGIADACKAQNVTLIGGETAEMPGMYGDDYDLVGCINGIVEHEKLIMGSQVKAGDLVIGLASNGPHTNGYSLARRVLFEKGGFTVHSRPPELNGDSVGEALLRPHTCYWPAIQRAMAAGVPLNGMAHITGGGLYENIPRVLPENVDVVLEPGVMATPPIFTLIRKTGNIDPVEMHRVFNMGVGMVWLVPRECAESAMAAARAVGTEAAILGEAMPGAQKVRLLGLR